MQTPSARKKINQVLSMNGMATLDHAKALLSQIAFIIRSDSDFRNLLLTTEPHHRQACYDALKSRLNFPVKPLDVYIAEGKSEADRLKLPEYDPATNEIAESGTQQMKEAAQRAILRAVRESEAKGVMEFICQRCTFAESFPAKHRKQAREDAAKAGWSFVERSIVLDANQPPKYDAHCPTCTLAVMAR